MKTLALYVKPDGTTVNLKLTPNAQIVTYVVFVQKWVNGSSSSVAKWFAADLESQAGCTTVLDKCEGYDLILKANIAGSPDTAAIDPALSFDGAPVYTDTVHLPASEGVVVSREWSIIIPNAAGNR
jgi:hypothetical protein